MLSFTSRIKATVEDGMGKVELLKPSIPLNDDFFELLPMTAGSFRVTIEAVGIQLEMDLEGEAHIITEPDPNEPAGDDTPPTPEDLAERFPNAQTEPTDADGAILRTVYPKPDEPATVRLCPKCYKTLPGDSPISEHICDEPAPIKEPTQKQRERAARVAASAPPEPEQPAANGHKPKEVEKCASCQHSRSSHGRSGVCKLDSCGCPAMYLTAPDDGSFAPKDRGLKAGIDDERWAELQQQRSQPVAF